jgi:hypothetical protein
MTDEEKAAQELADNKEKGLAEITTLKEQLAASTERLNKYDGERKDYSEQTNLITDLRAELDGLKKTITDNEDEDTKHLSVTQEELRDYKEKENERFSSYNKLKDEKVKNDKEKYQKYLGEESLSVKDETLFDEICKEHDFLVNSNAMPETTGDLKADAKIAWREAENSLYRKKLAAGEKHVFNKKDEVKKPIVPGQGELGSGGEKKQTTTMPDNLPDDAKQFIALMGDTNNPDSVNRALTRS